jgi:20S proteasome alpha/beta subunit
MTAVVGFHMGDVVVIAADTRESASSANYSDGVMKIVSRGFGGLVTGQGWFRCLIK